MSALSHWNAAGQVEALRILLECCPSARWADGVMRSRPYYDVRQMLATARWQWNQLDHDEWLHLFASHDRLAETDQVTLSEESIKEQAQIYQSSLNQREELARAARAYQQRFGFMFITAAHGRSIDDILRELRTRIQNTQKVEFGLAASQHQIIAERRLLRLFALDGS